jgi:endo-1,4-beta-D-glucanase Y
MPVSRVTRASTRVGTTATAAVLVLLAVSAVAGQTSRAPRPEATLDALWASYRDRYVRATGEVVDPMRQGQVTSEAQSYALVRAVWMRDEPTFRRVLAWTESHLRRPDGLHAWLWDPATARVLDANAATDAEIDIAFALAMASIVFDRPSDATQARAIVRAIRTQASVTGPAGWFPSAGNWAGHARVINLSYFFPYVVPWFERLDPEGGWHAVRTRGYDLVQQALDVGPLAVPADFNQLDVDGALRPLPEGQTLSRLFSYDALRISWRIEMACRLEREARACRLSEALVDRLRALAGRDGRLATQYTVDGAPVTTEESTSVYAASLPAFTRVAPEIAGRWRATHLSGRALDALMRDPNRYYDANWVWFGLAAADGVIEARTPSPARLRVPRTDR